MLRAARPALLALFLSLPAQAGEIGCAACCRPVVQAPRDAIILNPAALGVRPTYRPYGYLGGCRVAAPARAVRRRAAIVGSRRVVRGRASMLPTAAYATILYPPRPRVWRPIPGPTGHGPIGGVFVPAGAYIDWPGIW